jgi:pimeloyl-ACP methyl ester carboxylesterase
MKAANTSGASSFRYREAQIDGSAVRFVDEGRGEPVLLLHGYPQSSLCWRHQIAALATSHRVIAPDWPGFGRSPPCTNLPPTYEVEVGRIGQLVRQLGLQQFNLIAHDYGGFLGLSYVCQQPEQILRFGILNSRAHGTFSPDFYRFSLLQRRLATARAGRALARLLPLGLLHRRSLRRELARGEFTPDVMREYLDWLDGRAGTETYLRFFAHYQVEVRTELAPALQHIRCPTAVIWGERDPYVPFQTAQELATRIPRATLTSFPDAGHFIMEARPREVTAALQQLLSVPASSRILSRQP